MRLETNRSEIDSIRMVIVVQLISDVTTYRHGFQIRDKSKSWTDLRSITSNFLREERLVSQHYVSAYTTYF